MATPTAPFGFPRRVVALYLLFCLGSVLLLTAGAVVAVRSLLQSQATGGALCRVGRLAAAIEMDRLAADGRRVQPLIDQGRLAGRLSYCAVVGTDGRFLAHTDRTLIGAIAVETVGTQLRWGDIDGVRFQDANDWQINEYHAPLQVDGEPTGVLRLGVIEPGWQGVVVELAHYAPWAIAAPLALIGLGVWWLNRATQPLAGIEARLAGIARQPHLEDPQLALTASTSIASVGWNRLVEHYSKVLPESPNAEMDSTLRGLASGANGGRSGEALQSLSEGIAVTDCEGRIDFANRAIAALLGAESLEGSAIDDLLAEADPEKAAELRGANLDSEVVSEIALGSEAGERTLRFARTPLNGDSSAGHVWTVRDITQQKLTEASRDQFIDTATHELRTPLANIKAYAETLATCDMTDVEQQKDFCNTINSEATRLARFVDDLLSISSMEVGSLGIKRQNVDVRRLLEEAADKIRPLMKQRSLTFEVQLSEKLGEAQFDKDKIAGLAVNLLGNAAKYTPEGGTVTLVAIRQEDEVKIEVRDTGVGIAGPEQAKVFDKFFRSDNPEVQDAVGTGLGLSLAREIARLHRGDLTLKSELGEGSTFTALLPIS